MSGSLKCFLEERECGLTTYFKLLNHPKGYAPIWNLFVMGRKKVVREVSGWFRC